MAHPINGTLLVNEFDATANPGEWTFTGATFTNQSDFAGNGAFALSVGFVVYVPATDINTALSVPGVFHRYKLTVLTVIDGATIDGTVLWDEDGPELDSPTNGAYCMITEVTANRRLGSPISSAVYPNLSPGATEALIADDARSILDHDAQDVENKMNSSGVTINLFDAVSEKSDGSIQQTDLTANGEVFYGIALQSIPDGQSGNIQFAGEVKDCLAFLSVSAETPVYVSATAGILSASAPTDPGTLVMKAGEASGATGQNLLIDKKKIVRN